MLNIYLKNDNFKEPEDEIYYLLAANGLFQIKKSRFFTATTLIFEPKTGKNLGWLKEHRAGIQLHLSQKIPFELVQRTISFFKQVCGKFNGAEAIILLYWDGENEGYEIVVPSQKVGPAALPFYRVGKNPEGWLKIGTIHSHGHIGAFHSSIDEADEIHDDGLHITIGNLDFIPSFACSIVCDGERRAVEPGEIIEGQKTVPVPDDWMSMVEEAKTPRLSKLSKARRSAMPPPVYSLGMATPSSRKVAVESLSHNIPPYRGEAGGDDETG